MQYCGIFEVAVVGSRQWWIWKLFTRSAAKKVRPHYALSLVPGLPQTPTNHNSQLFCVLYFSFYFLIPPTFLCRFRHNNKTLSYHTPLIMKSLALLSCCLPCFILVDAFSNQASVEARRPWSTTQSFTTQAPSSVLWASRETNKQEERNTRFLEGDELQALRIEVNRLQQKLQKAQGGRGRRREQRLEQVIQKAQQVDPQLVYQLSLERIKAAVQAGRHKQAEQYRALAHEARSCLPQCNLHGVWVAKSGDQTVQLINVTYTGDTLVATKLTGEGKGEVCFRVDCRPDDLLVPVNLGQAGQQQFGNRYMQRFSGKGNIVQPRNGRDKGSSDHAAAQWSDGELMLVGGYLSFAFLHLPLSEQIFLGRPGPELMLRYLRRAAEQENSDEYNREFLERCFEETQYLVENEIKNTCGEHCSSSWGCFA